MQDPNQTTVNAGTRKGKPVYFNGSFPAVLPQLPFPTSGHRLASPEGHQTQEGRFSFSSLGNQVPDLVPASSCHVVRMRGNKEPMSGAVTLSDGGLVAHAAYPFCWPDLAGQVGDHALAILMVEK